MPDPNTTVPNGAITKWVVLLVIVVGLYAFTRPRTPETKSAEQFSADLDLGGISHVRIDGNVLFVPGRGTDPGYRTIAAVDDPLLARLAEHGVEVSYGPKPSATWIWAVPLAIVLLVFAFFLFIKKQQGAAGNVFSLTKTRAQRVEENEARLSDVGGIAAAKDCFADVLDYLKNPERWAEAGVRLPRGVLVVGPPGCGKTLLARAVAGEAGAPFYSLSASEFVEMFVGVGAARVRDTFAKAKAEAPALIFIDELDAVGRQRGLGTGWANDEREQTLNQLLVCLDGFERNDKIVVLAATNRPDVLDSALLRPGRFDLTIKVDEPDETERLEILKIHTREKNLSADVNLEQLAARTQSFTGADLEGIANEAGRFALRSSETRSSPITMENFEHAIRIHRTGNSLLPPLESLLTMSSLQLTEASGSLDVRAELVDDTVLEGQLVWADGSFLKIRCETSGAPRELIVPKAQLRHLETLEPAESV
ncbi:MAG: AAA family ATPase [Planctomycetota bacterium]